MPDITMCEGSECPIKHLCYRHTAIPSEYRQSYFLAVPFKQTPEGVSCRHFWDNRKRGTLNE